MPIDDYLRKLENRKIQIKNKIKYPSEKEIIPEIYLDEFVLLPETKEHPDLLVAKRKLVNDKKIESICKKLKIDYEEFHNYDRPFQPFYNSDPIHNISLHEANLLMRDLNSFILPPNIFIEFLKLITQEKVYNGHGILIQTNEQNSIIDDLLSCDKTKGEWLNQNYIKVKDTLFVLYYKFNTQSQLDFKVEELDVKTLSENRGLTTGIDFNHWLMYPSIQGLPTNNNVYKGMNLGLVYKAPMDACGTTFEAFSDISASGFPGEANYLILNCTIPIHNKPYFIGIRQATTKVKALELL
ncbi:hypothetical protein J4471_00080 [Candidatus Woesearchaeota archaeon]|nr:hypothetical protein [Candidatus Woesearchaeota archaeon]